MAGMASGYIMLPQLGGCDRLGIAWQDRGFPLDQNVPLTQSIAYKLISGPLRVALVDTVLQVLNLRWARRAALAQFGRRAQGAALPSIPTHGVKR
jgi:hypothetical protein